MRTTKDDSCLPRDAVGGIKRANRCQRSIDGYGRVALDGFFLQCFLLVPALLAGECHPGHALFGRDPVGRAAFAAHSLDPCIALLNDNGLALHCFADQAFSLWKGLEFDSPRGPFYIDPQTRGAVQNIYIFRTEKINGANVNVKIDTLPMIKESGQP